MCTTANTTNSRTLVVDYTFDWLRKQTSGKSMYNTDYGVVIPCCHLPDPANPSKADRRDGYGLHVPLRMAFDKDKTWIYGQSDGVERVARTKELMDSLWSKAVECGDASNDTDFMAVELLCVDFEPTDALVVMKWRANEQGMRSRTTFPLDIERTLCDTYISWLMGRINNLLGGVHYVFWHPRLRLFFMDIESLYCTELCKRYKPLESDSTMSILPFVSRIRPRDGRVYAEDRNRVFQSPIPCISSLCKPGNIELHPLEYELNIRCSRPGIAKRRLSSPTKPPSKRCKWNHTGFHSMCTRSCDAQ